MKKRDKNIIEFPAFRISSKWRFFLLATGLLFFALFFFHKIFFVNADLGRHIKNGEIIFSEFSVNFPVLITNYFSFSEPDFPVINHHWGCGVIFFLVWKLFGFSGLSFFYVLINTATVFLFFRIAEKKSNFIYSFFFLILAIPLITSRTEIRPEAFSYFLTGLFYYILILFSEGKVSFRKTLFILIPLQVLWVNLHIFFVFGFFLTGVFWFNSLLNKKILFRETSVLFFVQIAISLINPNGIKGFIEPFLILREYGYMVAENQSVFFMQNRFFENFMYIHFEILVALSFLVSSVLLFRLRAFRFNLNMFLLLFFTVFSFMMIRGIPIWGLFFIPFASGSLFSLEKVLKNIPIKTMQGIFLSIGVLIVFFGLVTRNHYYSPFKGYSGLGLFSNINRSADFFKNNHLAGPVCNNYDIGGYLIFNLFPEYKVFVDNRPEAYSVDFFRKIYEPMQEKEEIWEGLSDKYNFNCIYFYRHDNTPHAQPFLIRRINDDKWAPVFVDDYTIIFLKRKEENAELIRKFELPKSLFSAIPQ